jgi:hypothetical protein
MDEYEDEELTCREQDCGAKFVHTAGEQQWMREKWPNDYKKPTRCKDCRKKRREASQGS